VRKIEEVVEGEDGLGLDLPEEGELVAVEAFKADAEVVASFDEAGDVAPVVVVLDEVEVGLGDADGCSLARDVDVGDVEGAGLCAETLDGEVAELGLVEQRRAEGVGFVDLKGAAGLEVVASIPERTEAVSVLSSEL